MGSYEPTGRVQPAIVSDHHRAPVWKQYRAPWLQSWRVELRERVLRERVLGGAHGSWRAGGACNGSHSRRLYVRERVQTRSGWCASVSSAYASVSSAALLRRGKSHIPLLGSGWG